ncbi:hypothetical protein LOZ61_006127 [Ophidiomyces ophidiicola]|nr:hypothetical protein LOZ61_006127 [Ophidiomyces ophidiicola]KAI1922481.1 hypothetical protein LOZ60_005652 [Ophidiomyces ophidiicola]KAI2008304.1 hypothetical protein LOZ49_004299 [Ophidiomyces ophidiicola]KAI2012768.1 hypothetical protein LOZ46_005997 [Ophidiomyces ophidiicola]KAI2020880.1 hypothetical protein LOZ45_004926 [Ophidiomyces ophidiicola]
MSAPDLHNSLLRPPILQILRAAGFHSARPAVIDTLTDIAARYLFLLSSSTVDHALNNHSEEPVPNFDDILMALDDAGALRPQKTRLEENLDGIEDMRGLESFLRWFNGPVNTQIRRIAGFVPSEGDVVEAETEDYLTALKKRHSKTGEESRFQGTLLGKDVDDRPVVIAGGVESIKAWRSKVKSREASMVPTSTTISSISSTRRCLIGHIGVLTFTFDMDIVIFIPHFVFSQAILIENAGDTTRLGLGTREVFEPLTMVFCFSLPTTSHLSFQSYLTSASHPSLPSCSSTARHALRVALKKYKALPPPQRTAHLSLILAALNEYLPYLFALSRGISSSPAADDEVIDVALQAEIEVEWRGTISSAASALRLLHRGGRDQRIKGYGLDFEIAFVLTTLGYVLSDMARTRILSTLYANTTPTVDQKTAAVNAATKHLLAASSVHSYLASSGSSSQGHDSNMAPDLDSSTQSALSSLAMAEATLLAVLKDDAYLSACIQARNRNDTEWMIKAPDLPKVRTLLFARLCVRAAEYAEQAAASAGAVKSGGKATDSTSLDNRYLDEHLIDYMSVLAKVARAKACRFFGIDAEMSGKTGEGIAWLRAGKSALGVRGSLEGDEGGSGSKSRGSLGFSKLKRQWSERREEKKLEETATAKKGEQASGLDWGDDAGREEEIKVLEMLETRWMKMNDTVNTQFIPSSTSYLSSLPSGRDIHTPPSPYVPPKLDSDQIMRLRGPPDSPEPTNEDESSDSEKETPHDTFLGQRRGYF